MNGYMKLNLQIKTLKIKKKVEELYPQGIQYMHTYTDKK